MRMLRLELKVSILAVVFVVLQGANAFAGEIKLGTGETAMKNVISFVRAPFEKSSGIRLTTSKTGSSASFVELSKGNLDVSTSDMSISDLVAKAKKQGIEVGDAAAYNTFVVNKFRVVPIVNKDNPVQKLSKEQLSGIFSGTINNWKSVGGPDLPIIVVWNSSSESLNSLFTKNIMEKLTLSKDKAEVYSHEEVKQIVVTTPEAIGIASDRAVDATVKSPGSPEVSREIILVTKGKPSDDVQKFIDFIKTEGPRLIL